MRLPDGQSLLQKAFVRAAALPGVSEILTVGNRDLFFKTDEEYRKLDCAAISRSYILEPHARNTAAAVAVATLQLAAQYGEEVVLLILAADHLIDDADAFGKAVARAVELASQQNRVVAFGIEPTSPETGFGYIEAEGSRVLRFVEKPSAEKALAYMESGNFFWNAGIFCFSARPMLREMALHCPTVLQAARACMAEARKSQGAGFARTDLDPELFASVPQDSIDFAVMEKCVGMAVVPCNIGWSDIGSWTALGGLLEPDGLGNRVRGDVWMHDVQNCHIQSEGRTIGLVGLRDLIVVDTPDALLVACRHNAQEVKSLYGKLQAINHETSHQHRTVHRPWGSYTVLEGGAGFKLKRIEVVPKGSLSLQMHHHRSEHWVVVSGTAEVINGDAQITLRANQSTYIPAGHKHRLTNPGIVPLVMIEVQCGEYLGEDDIVRYEDVYGRVQ